ncbi:MAG: rRNA (guanine-N2)-methyltransferase, partial [Brooklawnia sp.]|nr:rRNA (guanine-N2)-methyltransferase [Brooklawnia sp.]
MDPVDAIITATSPEHASHLLVLDAPALVELARTYRTRVSVWCDDIR